MYPPPPPREMITKINRLRFHSSKCPGAWGSYQTFLQAASPRGLQPPRPATGVSRALRARSVPGVSLGVSLGPFEPRAPECPKSVPRVSPECQKGVPTLQGHSRDTFWTLRSPGPEGPERTPRGTPRGTLPGHSGPEGPERLL